MATMRRMTTTMGAALAVVVLAGCAAGSLDPDPESVGQPPSASPTPSSTPEPTPEPSATGTTFTTQNGTASITLPEGWTVVDSSRLVAQNHRGLPQWDNVLQLLDADGASRASYYDGYGSDVGAAVDTGVVRSLPMAGATTAVAWWSHDPLSGTWFATAAVVTDPDDPTTTVLSPVEGRLLAFGADLSAAPECASIVDEATAVACLESPAIAETLAVLATLELTDVPWDAMP